MTIFFFEILSPLSSSRTDDEKNLKRGWEMAWVRQNLCPYLSAYALLPRFDLSSMYFILILKLAAQLAPRRPPRAVFAESDLVDLVVSSRSKLLYMVTFSGDRQPSRTAEGGRRPLFLISATAVNRRLARASAPWARTYASTYK